MKDEIRQDGKAVLKSEDGVSIPMFFNNLCGKNFSGTQYRDYIRNIALGEMGFKPGRIEFYRDGVLQRTGEIPKLCMGHRTKRFFQWSGKMGERF